jgi:hypothetical protein
MMCAVKRDGVAFFRQQTSSHVVAIQRRIVREEFTFEA